MIHQNSSLISRKEVQNAAVGYISDALAVAHIVQHLPELVPEAHFFDLPRMAVQVPEPALTQDQVKKCFPEIHPVIGPTAVIPTCRHDPW